MEKLNISVDRVLASMRQNGRFGIVERIPIAYDMQNLLDVIEAVGKARDPRFTLDGENMFTYENVVKWVMADPTIKALDPHTGKPVAGDLTKGIYIGGNTGSGKSWCLELASYLAHIVNARYKAGASASNLEWRNHRAAEVCKQFTRTGDVDNLYAVPVLGLQDVGSEPQDCTFMGNRVDVIRQLLEYRGDIHSQFTLMTSNLLYEEMTARYGDRVSSRLYGMCNYYEIVGKDRRL